MKPKVYSLEYFRKDFLSGLIVFLIALPLCLGIAQASHAPLFSGIVAGIVGGIVIGSLSGSQLSVSGPAAGLTAIVYVAVDKMQHFDIFLCSVMIAGAVQLILGFIRAGGIANYIPSSVIEGMLAGIGLTIIIKQLPDAVGYAKNQTAFMTDADDGFVMNSINLAMHHIQEGAMIISVIGLAILILWGTKPFKRLQMLPGALLVVIVGTLINVIFNEHAPLLALESTHLVKLPVAASAADFFGQFTLPNFAGFTNPAVWETGVVIAIVASIETLLCIEATDKMDPLKRYTSTNRELKAQGVGNMISGFIGGLPITSVIVRSSANVNSGARSKMSAIIHGVLLLACAATIPMILNMIPKASLAAILLFTGYKLCKPASFVHMWKGGVTQFLPFVVTAIGVVSLDLLKGVGLGLVISVLFILRQNARISYFMQKSTEGANNVIRITLAQEVSFLNKAAIKETLHKLPEDSEVILDAQKSQYIDFDVLDMIKEFARLSAPEKNINIKLEGFKDEYKTHNNPANTPTDDKKQVAAGTH